MVFHMLLFEVRADLSDADRSGLLASLQSVLDKVPSIGRCHVGRRLRHGAAYENRAESDFGYAAVFEFPDVAGLREYLEHPAHRELGKAFFDAISHGLIVDYEMWEGAEAVGQLGRS